MTSAGGSDPRERAAIEGARLRDVRETAGISLVRMAGLIPYSRQALGFYELGQRTPPAEVTLWYERICGASDDPVTTVTALARADVDRRGFLRHVLFSSALSATALVGLPEARRRLAVAANARRVGAAEVDAIDEVTAAFLRLDEARGGGVGRSAVAEFLATDVVDVLSSRFGDAATRTHAFSSAAEVAYLAAFKAHDAGEDGVAQRYYLSALRLAEEASSPAQDAFAFRALALQGVDIRKRRFSVDLAEEAVRRSRGLVGADTAALFQVALARCHAESGNKQEALAALRRAEPAITPDITSEVPHWAGMWCPNKATVVDQTAKTFAALGDHREAGRHFELGATIWNPETHARVYALTCADAGLARWRTGDDGGAVELWTKVVPTLKQVRSDRTAKALTKIGKHAPELVTTSS